MNFIDTSTNFITNTIFTGISAAALAKVFVKANPATGAVFGATASIISWVALTIIDAIGEKCKASCNPSVLTKKKIEILVEFGIVGASTFAAMAITAKVTAVAFPFITAVILAFSSLTLGFVLQYCCGIAKLPDSSPSSPSSVPHPA